MKLTKRLTALLLALVLALALAACGGGDSGDQPASGAPAQQPSQSGGGDQPAPAPVEGEAVYRTLYAAEVTTLNYLISGTTNELSICANVVDCLVEYDSLGNVKPALATEWSQNADATVWTFKLREGVKWVDKNGNEVAEVTADDWVASAHYVCDAKNDSSTFYTYEGVKGAQAYYDWTAYQMALPNAKDGTDENGNPCKIITNEDGEEEILDVAPEASLDDIGVKAVDKYTLEFTLEASTPYFVSTVSFGPYMPVNGDFLAKCGDKFGTDNDNLLYCGAFILSDYQPQVRRVLSKNASYWDKDNVFLDEIRMTYNAEASSISATMYQSGEVDQADISSDLLTAMMADPATAASIHPSRPDTSYSYWYLFNFDPNFDEEFEPENWSLAVNSENFRKSVICAMNRMPALAANDRLDPASFKNNTITPAGFTAANGKDFASYGGLAAYTEGDNFDEAKALQYKDAAIAELTAKGAHFPVKMLMCYNPTTSNWANECQVVEQQIESVLGTDYVDIIVQAGPESGFLGAIRRTGKYAFMKCNWGADYADPQTWTDPFANPSSYNFIYKSSDPDTLALYDEYSALVDAAKAITDDMDARYEAFAKAETFFLDHAFALPIHTSSRSYQMCNLNMFEGQYSSFGMANLRYKGQHLYDHSMGLEEFQAAYAEWTAAMAG